MVVLCVCLLADTANSIERRPNMLYICAKFGESDTDRYQKDTIGMERLLSYTGLIYFLGALILIFSIRRVFQKDYDKVH